MQSPWKIAFLLAATFAASDSGRSQSVPSSTNAEHSVRYDEFGDKNAASCLVVLHGASGLALPFYKQQGVLFAAQGFHVLLPHYFEATSSTSANAENLRKWVSVAEDFLGECRKSAATRQVLLMGFSLGASVALAAGSEGAAVDGIAEWYGSLPDDFFYKMKSMPPLLILHGGRDNNIPIMNADQLVKLCTLKNLVCDHHFYPDQGHGFSGEALQDANRRTLRFFANLSADPNSR